ncbi:MAG: hypothetical protein KF803_13590 [Cyclobacteriaceae bacterium]|nr:hypothetical protein [Cyclobacteriaceae bacterium]
MTNSAHGQAASATCKPKPANWFIPILRERDATPALVVIKEEGNTKTLR